MLSTGLCSVTIITGAMQVSLTRQHKATVRCDCFICLGENML